MPHIEAARQGSGEPEQTPASEPGAQPGSNPNGPVQGELPVLTISDVGAAEGDRALRFTVSLSWTSGEVVTVAYATEGGTATSGLDYRPAQGTLSFAADPPEAQVIEVAVSDDAVAEEAETFTVRLSDPQGATLATATATGTILDDEQRAVVVEPGTLAVPEGGSGNYAVVLGSQPTDPVRVKVGGSAELSAEPEELVFRPSDWSLAQQVRVTAAQDDDAVADEPVELVHAASGGGYEGVQASLVVTIVEDDVATLAVAGGSAAERAGRLRFEVTLSVASGTEVTVYYATGAAGDTAAAGVDYVAQRGTLRFAAGSNAARAIEVAVHDDALDEPDEKLTMTLSNARNASLAGGADTLTVTGTIENDDEPPELTIGHGSVTEGDGDLRFAVKLERATGRTVTVHYATADVTATAGADYARASGVLTFAPGTGLTQTIAVPVVDDALDEHEEAFTVTLSAAVNATLAAGRTATGTIRDDEEAPELTIADAAVSEGAAGGLLRFAVTLDRASGRTVTVQYATADATAAAGADFTAVSGTLTFRAGTRTQTIAVPIVADGVFEETETFTVTLSDPDRARLGDGVATGTITDDDERGVRVTPTALTLYKGHTAGRYAVVLTSEPTAAVTVQVAVPAGAAVSATPERLTFGAAEWATAQNVTVTASADAAAGDTATIEHTVSGGDYAGEPASSVTVVIAELPSLELDSLTVTGGGAMYPEFASDVEHYAVRCADPTTLSVTARTSRTGARLRLLRDSSQDEVSSSSGSLDAQVTVNEDHDLAIELSDSDGTVTYVVHCIPSGFPQTRILTKTDSASDGLLFATLGRDYMAIIDYNGVPRFHREFAGWVFQRHATGPLIDGKRVRYSVISARGSVDLLDANFQTIRTVRTIAPLTHLDAHDFKITENGNFLFISYDKRDRSYVGYDDPDGNSYTGEVEVEDSVIQEVTPAGTQVFMWNSWDHVKLDPDCRRDTFTGDYAHLNSLQVIDGDIVASLPGCGQVVRIDRSSGTGALDWKLGGTEPTRNPDTAYLEIVGDTVGGNEFCYQHQPTLTTDDTVLMYDNGYLCEGTRKAEAAFTRIVEYDISSGNQAEVENQYQRPNGFYTPFAGGVTMLQNRNWLIAWGDRRGGVPLNFERSVTISEVDPRTGTAHFELLMYQSDKTVTTYRVHHEAEDDVDIPLNLP